MSARTTVILADDHPVFRLGMKCAIEINPTLEIVGEADEGQEAFDMIEHLKPDIAQLDWKMPKLTGLDIILRRANQARLKTHIVILTMYDEAVLFNEALAAGARGYVLKDNAVSEIFECIEAVMKGEVYLSAPGRPVLVQRAGVDRLSIPEKQPFERLTAAERIVIMHIAGKRTTKEIAVELDISYHTMGIFAGPLEKVYSRA